MPSKKIYGVETSWYESASIDSLTKYLEGISPETLEAELKARIEQAKSKAVKASEIK